MSLALLTLEVVPTPIEEHSFEEKIRDVNDRPILRAAIHAKADILLTGDKDFLESGLQSPYYSKLHAFDFCPYLCVPLVSCLFQKIIHFTF